MSKSLLQTRIVDKLEVIMTQVDTMNKFGKSIPLIHLDILKSNIRMLYEQICELERVHKPMTANVRQSSEVLFKEEEEPVVSKAVEERIVYEARETISKLVESIHEDVANEYDPEIKLDFSVEIVEQPIVVDTPVAKVEEVSMLQVEIETPVIEEKMSVQSPIPDIFSSLQTIADRYKMPDSSLNEAMAISNISTVNTAVKQIRDLKSAIGINEKFLFINELFKGNMKEYTDAIVALSDAETLDLAHEVLVPLKSKYEWREDSAAYITLIDFLQRRFV
ncbi:MAG: hypothetical protein LBH22_07220 [Bacteroidales bacterium]|jgi:hypothetical protein|nr:hypothetical protein [Bacteroidales bacterium]